jgi:flagellar hook-length control protein FliK
MAPAADGNADRGKPRPVSLAALGERLRPMEVPDDKPGKITTDRGAVVFSLDAAASAAPPARDAVAAADNQVARHDPVVTHHLDLAGDSAWLDQLSRDIASSASADGHLRFTLAPEHLGRLEVQMAAGADGTAVRLTTESHEAHRIISDAQPQLMAEARAQGLRISEAHVELNSGSGGSAGHQAFGNQNSGGRPQPQRLNSAAETPARAGASPTEIGATDALYA